MDWEELARRVMIAFRQEKCVQAGWAFGVPENGRELWLEIVTRAVVRQVAEQLTEQEIKARPVDLSNLKE